MMSLPHIAARDTVIPGTDIKVLAGNEVWPLIGEMGLQEDVFAEVDTWLPERFMPGGANEDFGVTIGINPKPGDVMPFSIGGRRWVFLGWPLARFRKRRACGRHPCLTCFAPPTTAAVWATGLPLRR